MKLQVNLDFFLLIILLVLLYIFLYSTNNFLSFTKKYMVFASWKFLKISTHLWKQHTPWCNIFIVFVTGKIHKTLLCTRELFRYYYLIAIRIAYTGCTFGKWNLRFFISTIPNIRNYFLLILSLYQEKNYLFKWVFMVRDLSIIHYLYLLLLSTCILSKFSNPMFLGVTMIININVNNKKPFYFIFDKVGFYIYFNVF